MNYYKNLDILNSKRKQLYTDIQNISNDKELVQYLKSISDNIDSLLESLFEDEGDYEENKILVQEMLEFHISSLENLKNKLQQDTLNEADPKKGTGKKPKGSGRRLYTDENPNDTVSIKFKTAQDIKDTLSKASFKSKKHARKSQIINLIHQRVRAAYGKAKDPEVKARLKRALDYIEKRKEASKNKTKSLNKETADPQSGKAAPYGSGYAPVKELVTDTEVICDNCGWEWEITDGGKDPYMCHKCGHDNTPEQLNEKCWPGYTKKGMKTMFGKKYPNCVKK